jgi:HEPN domain-containing protein
LKHRDGAPSVVGALSQQMAEKYLKGLLVFYDQDYPKIHDLIRIANLLEPLTPEISKLIDNPKLSEISKLYVLDRYPVDIPDLTWEEAESVFEAAQKVKNFVIDRISSENTNPKK